MVCPQQSPKELGGACSFCEELAPFVKKQAHTTAKRAKVQNNLPRTRILPKLITILGASLIYFKESRYN